MKMTEVACLWNEFLAARGLTIVELKISGDTEREDELWREFLSKVLAQEEERIRKQAEEVKRILEPVSRLPEIFESFCKIPLTIYTYYDSRPEDPWVEPTEKWQETTVGAIFAQKQIALLQAKVIRKIGGVIPVKFKVETCHQYYEFREPHYVASLVIGFWIEEDNRFIVLIRKNVTSREGYDTLRDPGNWIP